MQDVILHAFNWRYAEIADRAREISECGYGAVLFPPPLYSDPRGTAWWQCYQPKDYRIIRSHLGGKRDLERAIRSLRGAGVRSYADIVFNHMANEKGRRDDPYDFPGKAELAGYRAERASFEADRLYGNLDDGLFSPGDFNPEGDIKDWHSSHETQEHWLGGLPDLELNDRVVSRQRECLGALSALGFDGYRVDAVKHLPVPHVQRVFQAPESAGRFIFGESLTGNDAEENLFLRPLLSQTRISYYDFVLHETLRRVFSPGGSMRELVDPAPYGQALPWDRAVTFAVTHDMPNNEGFRGQMLEPTDECLAHAYVLCRDGGVPIVFTDHGESAAAHPEDRGRWDGAWRRADIAAMIAFHNAVHGSPQRSLYEDDGFIVFSRGDRGIVAVNKCLEWKHPVISTGGLRKGTYGCLIHGHEMTVREDPFAFAIPPRQAQLWLFRR